MAIQKWWRSFSELKGSKCIRVYIGNEAGDLDSVSCALAMSYACSLNNPNVHHVPLFNFPKIHYNLKTEVTYAMELVGLSMHGFIFVPDILSKLKDLCMENRLEVVIVDHNAVSKDLSFLIEKIVLVIDHHSVVEPSTLPVGCEKRILRVGSCSSLVSEYVASNIGLKLAPEINKLLALSILIDTANFSPAQLVDSIDMEQYNNTIAGLADWNQKQMYDEVVKARFDTEKLSIRELMLKDAKTIRCSNGKTIFTATIHCALDDMLKRTNAWNQIEYFMETSDCNRADLLLMMGTVANGENRGFAWYAPKLGDDFNNHIWSFLSSISDFIWSDYYDLPQMPRNAGAKVIGGIDGKVISRKKALPIFLPWFENNC